MKTSPAPLKPLSLLKAILLFACTSAPIYISIYCLIPILQNKGLSFLASYLISFYPTFAIMFLAAFFLYWREGNTLSWNSFLNRNRLLPVKGIAWLWVAGLLIFGLAASTSLSFTGKWLASLSLFTPPKFLPSEINPLKAVIPDTFMGTSVHGQWGYAIAYFIGWFFNIFGEELLWRGYMLPRQEIKYGKWAWVLHGLLWTGWHIFWKWNILSLLPIALGIPFVAQRTKNTTVVIIVHGIANLIPLMLLTYYIIK